MDTRVEIGSKWRHYKHKEGYVTVTHLVYDEATGYILVIYYWTRVDASEQSCLKSHPLHEWLQMMWGGGPSLCSAHQFGEDRSCGLCYPLHGGGVGYNDRQGGDSNE